ncbi:MAG: tRNA-dihydrouridine synthase [Candidatus Peribacteraceae bacterium]|nr:tRNA-dihydrouridine synthase [Candidatus Peribacteraceae bacterium]
MGSYPSFTWPSAPRPLVALAPMAGVTDASYRQLLKEIAPEIIVYTELLSSDALYHGAKKTKEMLAFDPQRERPFIVQIFGKDPAHFLTAAKVVEQAGADGIDINMGCPAARVVSSCHGSALMKNPDLAAEIVAAAKKAVSVPVSVKTRLGWSDAETLIPFCRRLVEAGADALAVHARTYTQKFSGAADWEPLYALKDALPAVTILGNGDIMSGQDAVKKIGNLDGVMVGRATIGNPWVMREVVDAVSHSSASSAQPIFFEQKIPFILRHCELAVSLKGERKGMLEMRRHLAGYVKGIEGAKDLRAQLVRVEHIWEVEKILSR